jgi:deazaflavin-dependent oxidoreductase (nitroreductase family)
MVEDFNQRVIREFRENAGQVGPPFDGAPVTLMHHLGRKSGTEFISPVMYLADDQDPDTIYVFASNAGQPPNPSWYYNLTTAGEGVIEVGTQTYTVTVEDVQGAERDRIYAEQAARNPGFADYEKSTTGIRTIPVLALRRK